MPPPGLRRAFTLIELLIVIAIMVILMALLAPAFRGVTDTGNVAKAAYTLAGALESARSYAVAHNTYVWVGFHEEDASQSSPAPSGVGRVILSTVASRDGTRIYDPDQPAAIPPARLLQVGRLERIENIHLKTAGSAGFPLGSGENGGTFDTRPVVGGPAAQIGDSSPAASPAPFQYPVGDAATAQYVFTKVIEFSPRGEARVNTAPLSPVLEIGLQPTHANEVDLQSADLAAVQISAIVGNVSIFRR